MGTRPLGLAAGPRPFLLKADLAADVVLGMGGASEQSGFPNRAAVPAGIFGLSHLCVPSSSFHYSQHPSSDSVVTHVLPAGDVLPARLHAQISPPCGCRGHPRAQARACHLLSSPVLQPLLE